MARPNRGKDFEKRFEKDWQDSLPNSFLLRLKDNTSGYKNESKNPSDFIGYLDGKLFLIETKAHYGTTLNFKSDLRQYDELVKYMNIEGVRPCVVVWFVDFDTVIFAPIQEIVKMREEGRKSLNVRTCTEYNVICVPSTKLRVFLKCDYSFLKRM